jgi:PAS domain S-box-containing protein
VTTQGRIAVSEDVQKELVELRRMQALHATETRVLEMIAEQVPLPQTLDALARAFEAHADGMLASVLIVEDGRVRHGASPSLPAAWAQVVDGEPIGPNRGSCGTAAYLKEPVIVSDIEHDERWALYREAALRFGLRACWSIPILDRQREVLGTFAFYYSSTREPTPELLALARRGGHLATLAIEQQRQRAEQKRLEHELNELRQREQLHAILEVAPTAVAITRDGAVRYANRKFVELFGFGSGASARARVVDPGIRERILADIGAGRAAQDLEVRALAQGGQVLDLLAAYRPIEYEELPSVLLYLVDVSRMKEAQHAAEAATRAKALFLAKMSHEIRTPLNAILGYTQLLRGDDNLTEAQRRTVEVIDSSGSHLLALMNDILDMSALEGGRATLADAPFDLVALLQDLAVQFGAMASEKRLAFECELDPSLPRSLAGDAAKIRQIIGNLLGNAVKFTEKGSVRLHAVAARELGARSRVTISVEDTGRGIAASDRQRIFEAFTYPGDAAGLGGAGLGLAISSSFARLLAGALDVESEPGQGSRFTFSFEAECDAATDEGSAPRDTLVDAAAPLVLPEGASLSALVTELPPALVSELRAAAVEARIGRIGELAEVARAHSARAALEIRTMMEAFRYEDLLTALQGNTP